MLVGNSRADSRKLRRVDVRTGVAFTVQGNRSFWQEKVIDKPSTGWESSVLLNNMESSYDIQVMTGDS